MVLTAIAVYFYTEGEKKEAMEKAMAEQAEYVDPDRMIEITTASHGLNCNSVIEKRREAKLQAGEPADDLPLVEKDNVLAKIKAKCDGKSSCNFRASTKALIEADPYPRCPRKLTLSYRCFSFDRLWPVSAEVGKEVKIDCRNK